MAGRLKRDCDTDGPILCVERPRTVAEAVYLENHPGQWFCCACLRRLANEVEQELHGPPSQGHVQSGPEVCSHCQRSSNVMRYEPA